jgi:prepilin-type N-terminal cleavage/methylation domain-containing protein
MRNLAKKNQGFTLIEILVVIGIIAVLAAIVIIAINPARQFAQARNSQRTSNVNAILNAAGQNIADNKGVLTGCGPVDATTRTIESDSGASSSDSRSCLVPTYMPSLPFDPTTGTACSPSESTCTTYNTGYTISKDATTGRITVTAPAAELGTSISVTR